jgi:YVTN family beta-propeller protein
MLGALLAIGFACGSSGAIQPEDGAPQHPTTVAPQASAPKLVVANQTSHDATIIDLTTGRTIATVRTGTGPHEAATSPDGRWAVVTNYGQQTPGNSLTVIDLSTATAVRTIPLGTYTRPHGAVFFPDGRRLAVTSEASQNVVLVDFLSGEVEAVIGTGQRGSHMLAMTADGKRIYTANVPDGTASELDVDARRLVRTIPVSTMTEAVAVNPDGSRLWVGSYAARTMSVVDLPAGTVGTTLTGFGLPYRVGVSPDGRLAVVCDPPNDQIRVVDAATRAELATIAVAGSPRGVTFAADGAMAYVTLGEAGAVAEIDLAGRRVARTFPVGSSPDGIAFAPGIR